MSRYLQTERDADEAARCSACGTDYYDWRDGMCRNPECPSRDVTTNETL